MNTYYKANFIILTTFLLLLSSCDYQNEISAKCKKIPDNKTPISECEKLENSNKTIDQNDKEDNKCNKIGCLEKHKVQKVYKK